MKIHFLMLVFIGIYAGSCAQSSSQQSKPEDIPVVGPCEGCEAIFESTVPFEQLNERDTLSDFSEKGKKILLRGTVYQADGKTPANGVVLYVYHTDETGRY